MNSSFLSIGTNLGDRENNIRKVISFIQKDNIKIISKSSIYETEPIGYKKQNYYYNSVFEVQFKFNCKTLFLKIKNIEHEMGRNFYVPRNYPRIIDIDILTFNDDLINNNMFRIPHTKLSKRKFVLMPWNEISSNYEVPELNKNISILLNDVKDLSIIRKLDI